MPESVNLQKTPRKHAHMRTAVAGSTTKSCFVPYSIFTEN